MLAMRPNPNPERLPDQSVFLRRMFQLKRDGYGWEDIAVKLRSENIAAPDMHIRRFVLGVEQ